jgi:hypothetical protein
MEARHAAGKINDWLKRLRTNQALLLAGLYTEQPWSEAVTEVLPFGLAGAAAAYATVNVEHLRAIARCETRGRSVKDWIDEVVRKGRRDIVDRWRSELELELALAIHAYDRARGKRPCVVPQHEEES